MKMKCKTIIFLFIITFCVLAIPTYADFVYDIRSPIGGDQVEYSILTTTSVNISWVINTTNTTLDPGNSMNCTAYNRSSIDNNFTAMFDDINVTNSTFANRTVTVNDGNRVYWYINCSTRSLDGNANVSLISAERVFDVDLDYFTLSLGLGSPINLSLDKGNIVVNGTITAKSFSGIFNLNETQNNSISLWNRSGTTIFPKNIVDNIGIGTISPGRLLEVAGSINGTQLNISGTANLAYGSGLVGIGTSTPFTTLTIVGAVTALGPLNATGINTTTLIVGKNLTILGGNLTIGSNQTMTGLQSKFIQFFNSSLGDLEDCSYSPSVYGQVRLNASGKFIGCNGTVWARLNGDN